MKRSCNRNVENAKEFKTKTSMLVSTKPHTNTWLDMPTCQHHV